MKLNKALIISIMLWLVSVTICGCIAVHTDSSVVTSGMSQEETKSVTQAVLNYYVDVKNDNYIKHIKEMFTAGYWHSDWNGDGICDISLKFFENGEFCAESETGRLADMEHWELAGAEGNEICFYNSRKMFGIYLR